MIALILAAVLALSPASLTLSELVHHGGQYHEPGVSRFLRSDPLAVKAWHVGRRKAPHAAERVFVKVQPEYGESYHLAGALDQATHCAYVISVYKAVRRHTWNVVPMFKLCPVGD